MADSATATSAPTVGGAKRDSSNPWGRPVAAPSALVDPTTSFQDASASAGSAAAVVPTTASSTGGGSGGTAGRKTLADIMAEEEEQKRAREAESEEDRMVRLAMEASLLDSAAAAAASVPPPPAAAAPASASAEAGHDHLDEEMRLAIALSLRETGGAAASAAATEPAPPAAAVAATTAESAPPAATTAESAPPAAAAAATATAAGSDDLSEEEAEAIARAIRQADDEEAAASLRLALELQREEERDLASERRAARAEIGNVRTVFKDDFLYERGDPDTGAGRRCDAEHDVFADSRDGREERKLWGADDFESHQSHYAVGGPADGKETGEADIDDDDDDESPRQSHEGFRMNASTPSKSWSRLDRNTIVGPDNEIRTKHDVKLKNRSNAERLLGPREIRGADDADGGIGVSDQAYNKFRQSVKKRSTVKGVAAHGHGRAEGYDGGGRTRGGAMDGNVRLLVTRAVNTGLIDGCNGVVKEGKEAIVYHADAGSGTVDDDGNAIGGSAGHDVAVKVFKRIQEFRGRGAYVDGDSRYHGTKFKNVDSRKQVELWAEKEYRNLVRANRAGVPVPSPLLQKENVLFMRFLGEDGWPSPQLREVEIKKGSSKWETLYCQVMMAVRRLYHCARLVHGDLSEYNILICPSSQVENVGLWSGEGHDRDDDSLQIVLIDFGQAVERQHPSAMDLLRRDLKMVRAFFVRQGIQVLTDDSAETFVLTSCRLEETEGNDDNEDSDSDTLQEELEEGEASETDETNQKWRHSIPGWNDEKDYEVLQQMLKTAKLAKP